MTSLRVISRKIFLSALLSAILASCSSGIATQPIREATSTVADTDTAIPTSLPSATVRPATITPLPTRPTATIYPPYDPPADWPGQPLPGFQVSLQYPPGWQIQTNDPAPMDGEGIMVNSRCNAGEGQNAVCTLEANRLELYGSYPAVNLWNSNNGFYGCAILPSSDASAPELGTLLAWYPYWVKQDRILQIEAPIDFLVAIGRGLQSDLEYTPPTGNPDLVPSDCYLNKQAPKQSAMGGLNLTTFRLTSSACYQSLNVESFATLLPKEAAEGRSALWNAQGQDRELLNQQLKPFGYQIHDNILYKEGAPQTKLLGWVGAPLINASRSWFILPITDSSGFPFTNFSNQPLPAGEDPVFYSSLGYVPHFAFLEDDLLWVQYDIHHLTPVGAPSRLQLMRNDEVIFTYSLLPSSPASGPLRGLNTWDGHWYLEVSDVLIRDGVVLNQELGYSEIFGFRIINEQPFYFYRQGSQIYVSYNGVTIPGPYQQIIHEPSCCSAGLTNMTLGENGLGFFAEQDGYWVYVIIEG